MQRIELSGDFDRRETHGYYSNGYQHKLYHQRCPWPDLCFGWDLACFPLQVVF